MWVEGGGRGEQEGIERPEEYIYVFQLFFPPIFFFPINTSNVEEEGIESPEAALGALLNLNPQP